MLLIRLKLENFRQHQDTLIEFEEGMTAIVGANGTGKSTVLEGITYALYGAQRDTRETIRFYWGERKKFVAELTFLLDGKRYTVERTNTDASLKEQAEDGSTQQLAVGLSDVRRACERLIGLNYEQFINSFSAEQKNLGFLNFRTAAARQDEVARMLGFDRLKRAEDMAKERRSALRAKAEALGGMLGNLADIEREKKEAGEKLKTILGQIADYEKEDKKVRAQLEASQTTRQQAEKYQHLSTEIVAIRSEAGGLKSAVKLAESGLLEAQKNVAEIQNLEPKEVEYKRLEGENKEWERRKDEDRKREILQAEAKTLAAEVKELEQRLKSLPLPDLGQLEKTLIGAKENENRIGIHLKEAEASWQAQRGTSLQSLAGAKARFEEAKKSLQKREAMLAKGICPECGQPLAEGYTPILQGARAELRDREIELQKAEDAARLTSEKPESLVALERESTNAKAKLQEARAARESAAVLHGQASTLTGERNKKSEAQAKLEATLANSPATYDPAKHQAVKTAIETLEPLHLKYLGLKGCEAALKERENDHKVATAALEAAKSRYKAIEAERETLPFKTPDEAQQAIATHQALEMHARDIQGCLRNSLGMKDFAQSALDQAEARLKEHKSRAKELDEAKKEAAANDTVAREMRALRENLNRTIGPDLAARASENLNLLTNGRYTTLELGKDFEPTVIEDGVPKRVISGGEEDVVALALRLALSELIQERNGRPMTLLVLDEVFGSLDVERRFSVLDRLASLKGRFRQILVISHLEEINQVADHALFLSRDSMSRSTVVSDAPPDANAMLL